MMTIEEQVDLEMSHKLYEFQSIKPDLTEDYLSHHGILNQKWGVRHGPPYPLGSDVSTGHKLKSGASGSIRKKVPEKKSFAEKRKAKKTYKKRVQAAQKAREARAAKQAEAKAKAAEEERKAKEAQEAQDRAEREQLEREQWKRDVINRGDVETAKQHTDLFSNEEIGQIIDRYKATDRLSQIAMDANPEPQTPEQIDRLQKMREKVDKIQKFAGTVSDLASSVQKVYNAYNTVNDILQSGGKKAQEQTEAQRKANEEKEKAWKKNVIMTRDMKTMMANKNKFTSSEVNELLNNVDADEKLADRLGLNKNKNKGSDGASKSEEKQSSKNENKQSQPQQPKNENKQPQQQPQQPKQQPKKENKQPQQQPKPQNATPQRQDITTSRDRQYYQGLSTPVLTLMRANLIEDGYSNQAAIVKEILNERRQGGELQYMPIKNTPKPAKKKWGR